MSSKEYDSNDNGANAPGGSGGGSDNAGDKRVLEIEELKRDHKKVKTSVNAVAQEFTCPITHALMVYPVTARDGHLYEREAIEDTIRVQGNKLKSPKTGLKMKPELLPAVSVKNTIEALVESGAIDGELAEHYKQGKLVFDTKKKANEGDIHSMQSLENWYRNGSNGLPKDKKIAKEWHEQAVDAHNKALFKATRSKAKAGEANAMYSLVEWYIYGEHGLPKDDRMAAPWLKKAAALQHIPAMATYATFVSHGKGGIARNTAHGAVLSMEAAMLGSDLACYNVGFYYAQTNNTAFPKNYEKAKRWLTKATDGSCAFKHAKKETLENAKTLLETVIWNEKVNRILDRQANA